MVIAKKMAKEIIQVRVRLIISMGKEVILLKKMGKKIKGEMEGNPILVINIVEEEAEMGIMVEVEEILEIKPIAVEEVEAQVFVSKISKFHVF